MGETWGGGGVYYSFGDFTGELDLGCVFEFLELMGFRTCKVRMGMGMEMEMD